ncbi:MAG: hypothetical protein IBX57_08270 [Gammaproteobacteria bacterium]|nr:hypothetical protein [Gammaproteobacteria bacterium]
MNEKGFFASMCDFFCGLFSSGSDKNTAMASASTANNDRLTGVERYIRNQAATTAKQLTGVEKYIRNQTAAKPVTGVEAYIQNQATAKPLTGVEKYIRNHS